MKRITSGLVAFCLLGLVGPAASHATDKIAPEPAATLLLPYFEVDLNDPNGATTLLSINNASDIAVLAHVAIWSDLSVLVLDYNIYLTGYDVQTINLRDVLVCGNLSQTASAGQDPSDAISPQGPFSQDANFPNCSGQLPPPPLPPSFLQHLALSLTGKGSPLFAGLCAGRNLGDNVARGYITVDTVNNCTLRLHSDPGYFGNGGDVTDQNVLWGDYFYVNQNRGSAEGNTLVHIVADPPPVPPDETAQGLLGQYTFYGRYVGWSGVDHRRALATNFAVRYIAGGTFGGGTSLVVWRDSKTSQSPFTCPVVAGSRPSWFPLGQEGVVMFDETEQAQVPQSLPFSPQSQGILPFPGEAQRVAVGGSDLPVPFNFGWLYLDLNTQVAPNLNPPNDRRAAQAWVAVEMDSGGTFSVGFDAIQLDNATRPIHRLPGQP